MIKWMPEGLAGAALLLPRSNSFQYDCPLLPTGTHLRWFYYIILSSYIAAAAASEQARTSKILNLSLAKKKKLFMELLVVKPYALWA